MLPMLCALRLCPSSSSLCAFSWVSLLLKCKMNQQEPGKRISSMSAGALKWHFHWQMEETAFVSNFNSIVLKSSKYTLQGRDWVVQLGQVSCSFRHRQLRFSRLETEQVYPENHWLLSQSKVIFCQAVPWNGKVFLCKSEPRHSWKTMAR